MTRADVELRSDHVGGRKGPRPPVRLLQSDPPRPAPDRRAPPRDDATRARRHPTPRPTRRSGRHCGSCRRSSPTTRRSISTRTCASSPSPRPATVVRCSTSAARSPSNRSTAARPLWEFTLIDGLADGRAAMLQKVHHTITDGVGGLKLSVAMVDFERDPEPKATRRAPAPRGRDGDAALGRPRCRRRRRAPGHRRRPPDDRDRRARRHPSRRGARPRHRCRSAPDLDPAPGARHRLRPFRRHGRPFPPAPLRGLRDRVRADATPPRPSSGAASTTCSSPASPAALGRYHERVGSAVDELRLAMPISTRRRGDTTTNSFVPARVLVPIQPAHDVHTLFGDVRERLQARNRRRR